MIEETLNKIIASIESQDRSSTDSSMPVKDEDSVNLSLADLTLLADFFSTGFPEELKLFTNQLSEGLKVFNNPELSPEEKHEKEAEIVELFERNLNGITYLNSLNRILIAKEYNGNRLEELNRSYNFPASQVPDYPASEQYLEKLAESYVQGNNSHTIQYLLRAKNPGFLESSGFIEDVKTAITAIEREGLKKKMQFLDELETFDVPESEVGAAIAESERQKMKEIMRKLDSEEESKPNHLSVAETSADFEKTKPTATVISFGKTKFTWRKYAVAAGITGLIAIAAVIVYNNKNKSPGIAGNKPNPSDTSSIIDRFRENPGELASSNFDSTNMVLVVKKEQAMGFAAKEEKITVHIYTPKEKKQIDSLIKLNKTYTFENKNLSVYLSINERPELYKMDSQYYLKIADTIYYIRSSDKAAMLSKVTDRNMLDRIDRISYQQDNK